MNDENKLLYHFCMHILGGHLVVTLGYQNIELQSAFVALINTAQAVCQPD